MHLAVYFDMCATCSKVVHWFQRYDTVVIPFTQILWILMLQHASDKTVGQAKGPPLIPTAAATGVALRHLAATDASVAR